MRSYKLPEIPLFNDQDKTGNSANKRAPSHGKTKERLTVGPNPDTIQNSHEHVFKCFFPSTIKIFRMMVLFWVWLRCIGKLRKLLVH